jgi:hypothetical protein
MLITKAQDRADWRPSLPGARRSHTFTSWINGEKASEHSHPNYRKTGPLALQIHGGVVMKCEFRNMRIATP